MTNELELFHKSQNLSRPTIKCLDDLLFDLDQTNQLFGGEMLSFIIDQVQAGADLEDTVAQVLGVKEVDHKITQAITEVISLMEPTADLLEGFTTPAKNALDFLNIIDNPKVDNSSSFELPQWNIELHQSSQNLQNSFTPSQYVFRDPMELFRSEWFTLIRKIVTIGNNEIEIALDAKISEEQIENLELHLSAYIREQNEPDANIPSSIAATISWGNYQYKIPIKMNSTTPFPPITFSSFLNETLEKVKADLTLKLEAQPNP